MLGTSETQTLVLDGRGKLHLSIATRRAEPAALRCEAGVRGRGGGGRINNTAPVLIGTRGLDHRREICVLDEMTRCDHVGGMKSVKIADLKAHLSEYLRYVREGEEFIVMDRLTPIARLTTYGRRRSRLTIRRPKGKRIPPSRVPLPPPLKLDFDVVEFLLEERRKGR